MTAALLDPFAECVLLAGNEAVGAWARAVAWAAQNGSPGYVPSAVAKLIASPKVWKRLVEARSSFGEQALAEATRDGGYQLMGPPSRPPATPASAASNDASSVSAKRAEAGRRGGLARAHGSKQTAVDGQANSVLLEANGRAKGKQDDGLLEANGQANAVANLSGGSQDHAQNPERSQSLPPYSPPPLAQAIGQANPEAEASKRAGRRGGRQASLPDPRVVEVLEHWASRTYHGARPKLTEDRRRRVAARLGEGFSVDDLKLACDGASHDDWLMGRADNSKKAYKDVESVLRDAAQVERLCDLARRNAPVAARSPSPPPPPPPPAVMAMEVPEGASFDALLGKAGVLPAPKPFSGVAS